MKRFYKAVSVEPSGQKYQIQLDARPVKTALGNLQLLPTRKLADDMALEWDVQAGTIDPALFRYRDLADFAIDIITPDSSETLAKLLGFIETDTLCYRADPDEAFFQKQQDIWEPVLSAFEAREGTHLERISGIMHKPQSAATHEKLAAKTAGLDSFTLASLLTMTSLAASLSIGMSALEHDADIEHLWAAANLEEDWQIEQWGQDYEAEAVRAKRKADFINAWEFGRLAAG